MLFVTLADAAAHVQVSCAMVRAGLAVLRPVRERVTRPADALLAKLEAEQAIAKKSHVNLWKWGDHGLFDDE